jgi:peptidase C25-like protein/PKD domain-containing protein
MKKTFLILLNTFFLLSTTLVIGIHGFDEINHSYHFEEPIIKQIGIDNKIYHDIQISGLQTLENPGKPCLPVKGAYLLIPYGMKVDSISIDAKEAISLGKNFIIKPASTPVPLSQIEASLPPTPDSSVYSSNKLYPGSLFEDIGTYHFRGYQILILTLHPVQYNPITGELLYFSDFNIHVTVTNDKTNDVLLRNKDIDYFEISKKIDNPNILATYADSHFQSLSDDSYDLLILTTNEYTNNFLPLKQAHDERGVRTKIKTLRDIKTIPSQVTPEDIRAFIKQEYQNNGIEYVLLGGDADIIPAKMLYVYGLDEGQWPYETFLPSDLYYACLDGSFNADGDDRWGESTDGENGNDVDLYAEVFVGRACVDSNDDVTNFVDKTVAYLSIDPMEEYLHSYLMMGEYLGNFGVASWGGNYLDLLIDESTIDGYTTKGIPSTKFHINKMYDREQEWNSMDIIDAINAGVHIINHNGHSNYGYNMKLVNNHVFDFTNNNYFFAYSVGCMAGGFDDPYEYDCFAEFLTVKTNHGAFAAIMNARYGWFWAYSTDGDGTRYTREFWDAVFGEKIPVISKANQDSKEDNIHLINRSCMRWTFYQLNLFGDPSLSFHISKPPNTPDKPIGPSSGKSGKIYQFSTKTLDADNDQVFYLFDWGNNELSEWYGPYASGQLIEVSHTWSEKGTYQIRVKAKDDQGAESDWSDPLEISMPKDKKVFSSNGDFFQNNPFIYRLIYLIYTFNTK